MTKIRLERRPTTAEIREHAEQSIDGLGLWLLAFDGYWEQCTAYVDEGVVIIDEVGDDGERWGMVTDAIALDDDGQPVALGAP